MPIVLPLSSDLGVPEVQRDELDSVPSLQRSRDRGLVQVDLGDVEVRLANFQHPGGNLLVSGLGEETVHIVHQQNVRTPRLPGQHHQLIGVDSADSGV